VCHRSTHHGKKKTITTLISSVGKNAATKHDAVVDDADDA
jgi:hypothetical protein